MIDIEINKKITCDFGDDFFDNTLKEILKKLKIEDAKISIAIVDNAEIQKLNLQYRGKDEPTDVLSFSNAEAEDNFESEENYLGEIIISWPYIVKQAGSLNHEVETEMSVMLRHGLLHLLGYTHAQMKELNLDAI